MCVFALIRLGQQRAIVNRKNKLLLQDARSYLRHVDVDDAREATRPNKVFLQL